MDEKRLLPVLRQKPDGFNFAKEYWLEPCVPA